MTIFIRVSKLKARRGGTCAAWNLQMRAKMKLNEKRGKLRGGKKGRSIASRWGVAAILALAAFGGASEIRGRLSEVVIACGTTSCIGREGASTDNESAFETEEGDLTFGVWRVDDVEYRFDCENRRASVALGGARFAVEGIGVDFLWDGAVLPPSELETRCVEVERPDGNPASLAFNEKGTKTVESKVAEETNRTKYKKWR